jgi:hypothetical protein
MDKHVLISVTITSIFLALCGFGGLGYVIFYTSPFLGPRWLLYFFLTIGLTGVALPAVTFLNYRFPAPPAPDGSVLVRQSVWFGILGSLLIWLQTGRFLNPALILFIIFGFILIETLIRWAERNHWQPNKKPNGL